MRIASLSPAVTEILYSIGHGDKIVCTDQFSNYPDDVREVPHLKDHQAVKTEDILEFKPDIIFTSTVVQRQLAEDLKIRGLSVVHQDPRDLNGVYETIKSIGLMFDNLEEANAVVLLMQQGFNQVKKKAALLPKRPKLYIEEWHEPPMASGNWVPEIARFSGGDQFPIQPGELSRKVSLEEVQQHDPDLIVISWCGAGDLPEASILTGRPEWDSLRAVREGNVRVLDDTLLNRPGPRLVEGAQRLYGWMFEMLH